MACRDMRHEEEQEEEDTICFSVFGPRDYSCYSGSKI